MTKKIFKATGKYLRLSPNKARRVLEQIKGKKYSEARLILKFIPYKCSKTIDKILNSAFYNMQNISKISLDKNSIIIKNALADEGPILKRFQPRAQGRAFPIRKPTCHIMIEIEN
uniref:Large ribosomal subunit protein uL22c n=1 Tax=Taenioma perpusillum TaxID=210852 RepID=A0A1Z1MRF4_9FLOR|nr:ribosomal protein L22 [Taenioma perpusillum]ARW68546.1 ribosomal protein L22 [Taenioma perpusillum]